MVTKKLQKAGSILIAGKGKVLAVSASRSNSKGEARVGYSGQLGVRIAVNKEQSASKLMVKLWLAIS